MRFCLWLRFFPDAIQIRITYKIDSSVRNCGRCDDCFRQSYGTELLLTENLASSSARLKNVELSALRANIQLAIGEHRRGLLNRAECFLPELLAGVEIKRPDVGTVVYLIKTITINHRRRETALPAKRPPLNLLFLDLSFRSCINGDHHTHLVRVEVLFAVRQD